jgi:hypothetical protein
MSVDKMETQSVSPWCVALKITEPSASSLRAVGCPLFNEPTCEFFEKCFLKFHAHNTEA